MRPGTVLAVSGAILAACLAVLLSTHEVGFGTREDGSIGWRSWDPVTGHEPWRVGSRPLAFVFEDPSDRKVFQECGRWLPAGLTPYLQNASYYPQLSTWLMGVPYLFYDHGIDPDAPPRRFEPAYTEEVLRNRIPYGDGHHVMMALAYFAALCLLVAILRELGRSPAWAFLFLLPASLFYGFNRFDLVVTCLVLLAVLMQIRGRRILAAVALGLGIMTKWYPLWLVAIFLSHGLHAERARLRREGLPAPWGPLLLRRVILPGLVVVGTCVPILAITYLQDGGGWPAVAWLFRYHETFEPNHSSLLAMSTHPERLGWFPWEWRAPMQDLFKWLQVIPALLLALLPLRSTRAWLYACLASTLNLILFAYFFSPQWVVLWAAALGILLAPRDRIVAALVLVLGVLMYVQTPLLYYSAQYFVPHGDKDPAFWAVSKARLFLVIAFWLYALGASVWTALRDGEGEPELAAPSARAEPAPA